MKRFKEMRDNNNLPEYDRSLYTYKTAWTNLHLTVAEFYKLANAVYNESMGSFRESYGIINVLRNRANADNTDLISQVTDRRGYGVYGVRERRYYNEIGPVADKKETRCALSNCDSTC